MIKNINSKYLITDSGRAQTSTSSPPGRSRAQKSVGEAEFSTPERVSSVLAQDYKVSFYQGF